MKRALLLVGLLVVVAGCGPKNVVTLKRDAPAAVLQAGWYARDESGFSINVPESYQVPKNPGMSANDLSNLSNPAVGYGLSPGAESTTANAVLVLQDVNYKPIPGEPATGLTVNIKSHGGGADLEGSAKAVSENLMNDEMTKIELPCGPAYEIKHKGKNVIGDSIARLIYVICDGEKEYRLEFITTNGMSVIEAIAPEVAKSFRVK
jgi:hypothetical protein